jgi:hypothetical protein
MLPELAAAIPVFFLTLIMVTNVGMFVAEAARFDRICNEVARALVTSPDDPASCAPTALDTGLGYRGGTRGPFRATVTTVAQNEAFFERRVLTFRLEYRLFGKGTKAAFSRNKTLVIPWSRGL